MAAASVTGVLDTAAAAGSVLSVPLQANGVPFSSILFTLTGTLVGTWLLQASANNWETITQLGSYTASQTQIAVALPSAPPSANWQVRLYCSAYTSGTATYTLQLPVQTYRSLPMTGGGTADQVDDNGVTLGGILNLAGNGVETGITALYGGGQAGATQLSAAVPISVVQTALLANDSVMLPTVGTNGVTKGHVKIISNQQTNSIQVYGAGTDVINGVATGTGVALAGRHTGVYICYSLATANLWLGFSAGAA
jgi:hypothetical protein